LFLSAWTKREYQTPARPQKFYLLGWVAAGIDFYYDEMRLRCSNALAGADSGHQIDREG
jgi:hypothetical protein